MTQQRDIERLLDQWFSDGPGQAPDRVVDIVTDRIERQSQRPAWRLQWRPFPVNGYMKIAVAAAAVLIVAVVGYNLLPGSSTGVGGPAATPGASATPSASATTSAATGQFPGWFTERNDQGGGGGILAAGTHGSRLFRPALSFAIPDGWVNSFDTSEEYILFPNTPANEAEYTLSRDTAQAIVVSTLPTMGATAFCSGSVEVAGTTAAEIVDNLAASEALATTGRTTVTIGGLSGQQIDVRLDPGWTGTCPLDTEDPPTRDYNGARDRIVLLDTPAGGTFSIVMDSLYAADFDQFVADATPIVESLEFDLTP